MAPNDIGKDWIVENKLLQSCMAVLTTHILPVDDDHSNLRIIQI